MKSSTSDKMAGELRPLKGQLKGQVTEGAGRLSATTSGSTEEVEACP